jgi:hypothetical protein
VSANVEANRPFPEEQSPKHRISKGVERPVACPFKPDKFPDELKGFNSYVTWSYVRKDGTWTKVPYIAGKNRRASHSDPGTWRSFENACACSRMGPSVNGRRPDGVGFVFGEADPYCGIDLDDARDPETGEIKPWAVSIVERLKSYAEVSVSRTGIHIIVRAKLSRPGRKRPYDDGAVEIYDRSRYFTLTGDPINECGIEDRQAEVEELYAALAPKPQPIPTWRPTGERNGNAAKNGAGELPPTPDSISDEELLIIARRAKNGGRFSDLYDRGDISRYGSASEADAACLSDLAFWTGGNRLRMDALFRASALYRQKWERADYRQRTIDFVLAGRTKFFEPKPQKKTKGSAKEQEKHGEQTSQSETPSDSGATRESTGYSIIRNWMYGELIPIFRRGEKLFSQAWGRDVSMGSICTAPPHDLVLRLYNATDAPRDPTGQYIARNRLPGFFKNWAPTAYVDILRTLPFEEVVDEISDPAREKFRMQVARELNTLVSLGYRYDDKVNKRTDDNDRCRSEIERRSVIDWCFAWAKKGPWAKIRSYWCWVRRDDDDISRVRIALRPELFDQLHRGSELSTLGANKFGRLCELYEVGASIRATGSRAVELDPKFVEELRIDPDGRIDDFRRTRAGVRENARHNGKNGTVS